jgi:hydroxymethylpyrimidine pyrophosphatase-like HAD family hydrolase
MQIRGYDPEQCIAVGDSREDLDVAASVGRFFLVANAVEKDPALRSVIPAFPNVSVTEASNGDGFYEAIISTLAGAA